MTTNIKDLKSLFDKYNVSQKTGLISSTVQINRRKFGTNKVTERKPKSLVKRLIEALLEPMMIILTIAFIITLGINIGKSLSGTGGDYYECAGIFIAILVSVSLTIIMEGKSENAFKALEDLAGKKPVKVLRSGEVNIIGVDELVAGDIVYIEAGDKIPADGRIIKCKDFSCDESTLTGESQAVKKTAEDKDLSSYPLAERVNCLFSGTFCQTGTAVMIVTAVGDMAEAGKIAHDIGGDKRVSAPLNEKLSRLGKMVTIFGILSSVFVFFLSLFRLIISGNLTFSGVQDIFIQSIVLIVAAVPEGLPATVAISLTLNVLRLAKSNALIKKLVATETVGCVSVICSDKTGTLTKNKMTVRSFLINGKKVLPKNLKNKAIIDNICINSTADILSNGEGVTKIGSATETGLLEAVSYIGINYRSVRKNGAISLLTPFSSDNKYMESCQRVNGKTTFYIKGAPEVILEKCLLSERERNSLFLSSLSESNLGGRVIAFASGSGGSYSFDGFAVIADSLRDDIKASVLSCQKAGIKVKMLTGDNKETARYIAKEAGLLTDNGQVVTADYIESLTFNELKERIPYITVIARSTPQTKLKIVKALQENGEVVAVTGDGVNDAPAIKHADIGIAMGGGSEITKQASDIVLLDNSFSTILKAINFGRNVYNNFRRFITFQLTVNLASMCIIIANLLIGLPSPFTSTSLLWLNIIMDGPLALSLGLERADKKAMKAKPVKRKEDILSGKMLIKIGLISFVMCAAVILQRFYNFLKVREEEQFTVIITMFVFLQIFNAINCREPGSSSSLSRLFSNKLLIIMIAVTYALHILIITFFPAFFGTIRLSGLCILKITGISVMIVLVSEGVKLSYRLAKKTISSIKKRTDKKIINEKLTGYAQYE